MRRALAIAALVLFSVSASAGPICFGPPCGGGGGGGGGTPCTNLQLDFSVACNAVLLNTMGF